MTDKKKTEVNLEMCSGFFRIPTEDIIYNITVLASNEPSTTKVVEKIIEVEKIVEVEKKAPPAVAPSPTVPAAPPLPEDDYFKKSAVKFQQAIAQLATEAAGSSGASGPDLDAIKDLAAMASDLKEVLLAMKRHPLMSGAADQGIAAVAFAPVLERLAEKLAEAKALAAVPADIPSPPARPPQAVQTVTRYLFDLDAVFQTIYELCTNETVKGHIQNARARAGEIFDREAFYDAISPKVGGYQEDDGFLTVPMTDVYTSLAGACNDKAICNLLAKMDKQQATIFLDQFLPLEVPPREEVAVPAEGLFALDEEDEASPSPASGDGALSRLLAECQADLDRLAAQAVDQGGGAATGHEELLAKVEDAITIVASIHYDANRLAQGDGGQEGGDLLIGKVKELALLAETMIDLKAARPALTYEDGLAAGQAAIRDSLATLPAKPPPAPPSPPAKKEAVAKKTEPYGEASQDDIDRLLEELA